MFKSESEDVNHSLLYSLKKAEERRWTGIFKILKESAQIGAVVMYEGRIAWASSTGQSDNFASFLEKIGQIPKEQQKEIIKRFKILGKTKKFGELLEESGLISRPTLRKCLIKQIRSALDSLIGTENIVIRDIECEISVNIDLLFELKEILPCKFQSEQKGDVQTFEIDEIIGSENLNDSNELVKILKNLSTLAGYQYSFIYDLEAKMLASHNSNTFPGNLDEIMTLSISNIVSTNTTLCNSKIGRMEFILIEHDNGSLVAQWPNIERNFFVAASFDKNGKTGVIRHKISDIIPAIIQVTGENQYLLEK